MTFPQTRLTLIHRLSSGGTDQDWRQFLSDYWGPLCGFASRWGRMNAHDAEDTAAMTFEVLWSSDVLQRWHAHRAARLRTLLCSITRKVIANRARVGVGRQRILQELAAAGGSDWFHIEPEATHEDVDLFYAAWADDLLRHAVNNLLQHCHAEGKGDYFRVLFGRLCEGLSSPEIGKLLGLQTATVENYFKTAKARLAKELEATVRKHVGAYCADANDDAEFREEWARLSEYLLKHGGLEEMVRDCQQRISAEPWVGRNSAAFRAVKALPSHSQRMPSEGQSE